MRFRHLMVGCVIASFGLALPTLAQEPRLTLLQHVAGDLKDKNWPGVIAEIKAQPALAVEAADKFLERFKDAEAGQKQGGIYFANVVARVLKQECNLPDYTESLRKRGLLLVESSWNSTPLAGADSPASILKRMQLGTVRLRQVMDEVQKEALQLPQWAARANFAGEVEDYTALGAVITSIARPPRPELLESVRESQSMAAALRRAGIDATSVEQSSAGLGRQLANNQILNEVMAIRMEGAMGLYSKALKDGEALLPRVEEPDVKSVLLVGMVGFSLHCGYPDLASKYLSQATTTTPSDQFSFGVARLRLDVERSNDLGVSRFLSRYRELWAIFQKLPNSFLSRPLAQAGGDMVWLAGRMARRLPPNDPGLAELRTAQQTVLTELDQRGRLGWAQPPLKGESINPEWTTWLIFEKVLAQLRLAADEREAGHLEADRALLAQVKDFLPEMERKLPVLEPVGKQLFAGSGIDVDVRRGFFSSIPARYYEELGRVTLAGNPNAAATAVQVQALLDQAIGLFRRAGNADNSVLELAPLYALVANTAGAPVAKVLPALEDSLKLSQSKGLRRAVIECHLAAGELQARAGQKALAMAELTVGLKLLEDYMNELGGDAPAASALRLESRSRYELLARLQTEEGQLDAALSTLGRMQQASNFGTVAPTVAGNPKLEAALQQVRDGRIRMRSLEAEGEKVRSAAPSPLRNQATTDYNALIASNKAEFYDHLGEVYKLNPEFEKLAIRPVNFTRAQKFIPENTLVAQYFPTDKELYIFLLSRTSLKIRKVAVSSEQLDGLAHTFRKAILARSNSTTELLKTAMDLHRQLIDPIEEELKGKEVLAVIPTGSLLYLPFAALARPGVGGKPQFLLERFQTVSLVKASDFDMLERPAGGKSDGKVVAFGNPDGSLASASLEVEDIHKLFPSASVYLEGKATKAPLSLLDKEGVTYLHFATHGVLNANDPRSSHLVMAGANLSVNEIAGLTLGDNIRLVTLSACQTALGERQPRSELLQSMADAFGYAGSPSVVASLWAVSDDSTRLLMDEFYRQLKGGASRSLALQQAALKVERGGQYSNPYFWAPFVLMGDWR